MKEDKKVKMRFTPILVILVIIAAAILSRVVGASDYLQAQSSGIYSYAYQFFFCPYNRAPYTDPTSPYRTAYTAPNRRFPYPYAYPLPKQYPCPCTTPAVDSLILGSGQQ